MATCGNGATISILGARSAWAVAAVGTTEPRVAKTTRKYKKKVQKLQKRTGIVMLTVQKRTGTKKYKIQKSIQYKKGTKNTKKKYKKEYKKGNTKKDRHSYVDGITRICQAGF